MTEIKVSVIYLIIVFNSKKYDTGQSIQEWTKWNLRKAAFKKLFCSIFEYFVPYIVYFFLVPFIKPLYLLVSRNRTLNSLSAKFAIV